MAIRGDRLINVFRGQQDIADLKMGFGVVGSEDDCRFARSDGVVKLSAGHAGNSKVEVGFGVIGSKYDGPLVGRDGLIEIPLGLQNGSEIIVCVGVIRVDDKGTADEINPNVRPTYLDGNHSQMMHRQGVFRMLRQDLPVKLLSLRQPAILLVLDCQIERFVNRQLGHVHHVASRHSLCTIPRFPAFCTWR